MFCDQWVGDACSPGCGPIHDLDREQARNWADQKRSPPSVGEKTRKSLLCECCYKEPILIFISPGRSLRGAVATKQSQSEIATPFGLAMTIFVIPNLNYFMLPVMIGKDD